jgi:hypothetical protein
MIEGKGEERLLKDRHERFRQIVGQWPEAGPETGAQNEGLPYSWHNEAGRCDEGNTPVNCKAAILTASL